jgi:hypothetical protein
MTSFMILIVLGVLLLAALVTGFVEGSQTVRHRAWTMVAVSRDSRFRIATPVVA